MRDSYTNTFWLIRIVLLVSCLTFSFTSRTEHPAYTVIDNRSDTTGILTAQEKAAIRNAAKKNKYLADLTGWLWQQITVVMDRNRSQQGLEPLMKVTIRAYKKLHMPPAHSLAENQDRFEAASSQVLQSGRDLTAADIILGHEGVGKIKGKLAKRRGPVINYFRPMQGQAGREITVRGRNLEEVTLVTIGSQRLRPTDVRSNSFKIKIDAATPNGFISVSTPDGKTWSEKSFKKAAPVFTIIRTGPIKY